uniref:Putative secreted protein salivary gland overexpressed n=1 Tax=Rhipicephalus microplus TaxID=6941 RepID=A0A6M2DAD0_RHIMP
MARYGIMLLVCMFCFAGCHCGQTNDGTQKKLKINDTSNPAYCEQFGRSCIDGTPPVCPLEYCFCNSRTGGIFQTFYYCKQRPDRVAGK